MNFPQLVCAVPLIICVTYICALLAVLYVLGGTGSNTGGVDYIHQNYTFTFYDGDKNKSLLLHPVDDNIVEPEEIYSLTIRLVYSNNHVKIGENGSTTVTILDNDGRLYMLNVQ